MGHLKYTHPNELKPTQVFVCFLLWSCMNLHPTIELSGSSARHCSHCLAQGGNSPPFRSFAKFQVFIYRGRWVWLEITMLEQRFCWLNGRPLEPQGDRGWWLESRAMFWCFCMFLLSSSYLPAKTGQSNTVIPTQCDWDLLHPMVPFLGSFEVSESLSPGLFHDHPELSFGIPRFLDQIFRSKELATFWSLP